MSDNINNSPPVITLTDNAVKRIEFLILKSPPDIKLRISVDGGGCNGFQYKFDLVNTVEEDDIIIHKDGAVVIIDEISQGLINGCIVDYVETLGYSNFEIRNPNATTKCGCGNSFSI